MLRTSQSEIKLKEKTLQLARKSGELLKQRKLTIAIAESATGGLIQHLITNVPGSSAYFLGGIVAYANSLKRDLLKVPMEIIEQYGAVSQETASAMAKGIRDITGANIGLATTGIAGPTGGTSSKPIGLVFIATAIHDKLPITRRGQFKGLRSQIKVEFAHAALLQLLDILEKEV
jgi:PncC family amidohydrolase